MANNVTPSNDIWQCLHLYFGSAVTPPRWSMMCSRSLSRLWNIRWQMRQGKTTLGRFWQALELFVIWTSTASKVGKSCPQSPQMCGKVASVSFKHVWAISCWANRSIFGNTKRHLLHDISIWDGFVCLVSKTSLPVSEISTSWSLQMFLKRDFSNIITVARKLNVSSCVLSNLEHVKSIFGPIALQTLSWFRRPSSVWNGCSHLKQRKYVLWSRSWLCLSWASIGRITVVFKSTSKLLLHSSGSNLIDWKTFPSMMAEPEPLMVPQKAHDALWRFSKVIKRKPSYSVSTSGPYSKSISIILSVPETLDKKLRTAEYMFPYLQDVPWIDRILEGLAVIFFLSLLVIVLLVRLLFHRVQSNCKLALKTQSQKKKSHFQLSVWKT